MTSDELSYEDFSGLGKASIYSDFRKKLVERIHFESRYSLSEEDKRKLKEMEYEKNSKLAEICAQHPENETGAEEGCRTRNRFSYKAAEISEIENLWRVRIKKFEEKRKSVNFIKTYWEIVNNDKGMQLFDYILDWDIRFTNGKDFDEAVISQLERRARELEMPIGNFINELFSQEEPQDFMDYFIGEDFKEKVKKHDLRLKKIAERAKKEKELLGVGI